MEFREFIGIFVQSRRLLFSLFVLFSAGGIILYRIQPDRYEAALLLNVTRESPVVSTDYRYDHFYRLQADERFADTVVRWLGTPPVRRDIEESVGADRADVVDSIEGRRLSSQMIDIRYYGSVRSDFDGIDRAITDTVNSLARGLNRDAKEPGWFVVIGERPAVTDAGIPLWKTALGGALLGIFVGFWTVLLRWYWKA